MSKGVLVLNPGRILQDEDGNLVSINDNNTQYTVAIRDDEQFHIMEMILKELKRTNFFLSQLTDIDISHDETEEEE